MHFNPSINYEHWKTKEDGLLLQGIKEHRENWEIIAFEIFRNARNPIFSISSPVPDKKLSIDSGVDTASSS